MTELVKTENELKDRILLIPMIGNIYYDDDMNYIPIDWDIEYIKITKIENSTTVERIKHC
jgi:hypothetical protein